MPVSETWTCESATTLPKSASQQDSLGASRTLELVSRGTLAGIEGLCFCVGHSKASAEAACQLAARRAWSKVGVEFLLVCSTCVSKCNSIVNGSAFSRAGGTKGDPACGTCRHHAEAVAMARETEKDSAFGLRAGMGWTLPRFALKSDSQASKGQKRSCKSGRPRIQQFKIWVEAGMPLICMKGLRPNLMMKVWVFFSPAHAHSSFRILRIFIPNSCQAALHLLRSCQPDAESPPGIVEAAYMCVCVGNFWGTRNARRCHASVRARKASGQLDTLKADAQLVCDNVPAEGGRRNFLLLCLDFPFAFLPPSLPQLCCATERRGCVRCVPPFSGSGI